MPFPALPAGLRDPMAAGLAVGALTGLLFVTAALFCGHQARQQLKAEAGADLVDLAGRMVSMLDKHLRNRYQDIQDVAALEAGNLEPARWQQVLDRLQDTHTDYAWIGLADPQGVVRAGTDRLLEGKEVSLLPWFVQGLNQPYLGDVHEDPVLSGLQQPLERQPVLRLVDIAVPVRQGPHRVGVLGARMNWQWAEEVRQHLQQQLEDRRPVDLQVLSITGKPLLGTGTGRLPPERLQSLLSNRRHGVEDWSDGRYLTAAWRSQGLPGFPGLGWTVLARQPLDHILAPAGLLQQQLCAFGLLAAVLTGLLGGWLAIRQTSPLRRILKEAEALLGESARPQGTRGPRDKATQVSRALTELVTQLRERERDLTLRLSQLDERLLLRTQALQQANADLHSFSRAISHDLKGPIGSLGAATRYVIDQARNQIDLRTRQMLDTIIGECDRLVGLIDELLMLSRVDQQALQRQPLDLNTLVRSILQQALEEPGAPKPGEFEFIIDELPQPSADPALLRQVWQHLIGNAIKFSRGVEHPCVHVGAEELAKEFVFHVRDNGAGFDMRLYSRLFGIFERLHTAAEFPGTGMGLSIVKRVVQRHGGRVWAVSAPGEGASFYFSIPKAEPG